MPDTTPAPGISLAEANLRIAALSRTPVPGHCAPEHLDLPLDADIQATRDSPASTKIALEVEGQQVSWCWVVDFQQQIGMSLVRMGGIAGVGTHNDFRFRGYSRRVLLNALRWMRTEQFDVSMLYGISGFYPKFGYAEAFPGVVHTIAVRDAELAAGGHCRFVPYAPEHLQAVLAMYQANNAGRTGVIYRTPDTWTPFRKGLHWGSQAVATVALATDGGPAGYFVRDAGQNTVILEVGAVSPAVFGDLLCELAALAWADRTEHLTFHLPEDDRFIQFCRPLGLRTEITCRRDGGGMVRIIRLRSTLAKLAPLLASRVAAEGRLTLRTNLETVGLSWGSGRMEVEAGREYEDWVQMPQWVLAQLLYGYHAGDSPALAGQVTGTPRGLDSLAHLFPVLPHYQYVVDYF